MSTLQNLLQYAEKPQRTLIGLMSGTSVDGIDAVLVQISGSGRSTQVELVGFHTHPYPAELRQRVLDLSHGAGNVALVSLLNVEVGRLFAEAAQTLLAETGWSEPVDAIASHGQTVSHTPAQAATLQIGEAAIIAQELGVPVVADFRVADMAVGGQGAPLVPYADWCLLTHLTQTRVIQNIGGIGNLTYLPADATPEAVQGFDTGPGNMLIDAAVVTATEGKQTYDAEGQYALRGEINTGVLMELLQDPFLQQPPPKSAGREQYGAPYFARFIERYGERLHWNEGRNPFDVVAVLTAFTAHSIVDAYLRYLPTQPEEVIVGGGGTKNPVLMGLLTTLLPNTAVLTHEEVGINSDAKEAIAFAVLANETLLGNPSNLPRVTAARRPVILGKITLP